VIGECRDEQLGPIHCGRPVEVSADVELNAYSRRATEKFYFLNEMYHFDYWVKPDVGGS